MRFFLSTLQHACEDLCHARWRAALTIVSILMGTASVVVLLSIGQMVQDQMIQNFRTLGTDILTVAMYPKHGVGVEQPMASKLKQLDTVKTQTKHVTNMSYYLMLGSAQFKGQALPAQVIAVSPTFHHLVKLKLAKGRALSSLDQKQSFCVIGAHIAQTIKGEALGAHINLEANGVCQVIGVLSKSTVPVLMDLEPSRLVMVNMNAAQLRSDQRLPHIVFQVSKQAELETLQYTLKERLRQIFPEAKMMLRSPQLLIASMKKQTRIYTVFLGIIGVVSLLIGGLGIMNMMLMSVTQRFKEIGVRMAVGATAKHIRWQFLSEAMVLAFLGGLLGSIIGCVGTYFVAQVMAWSYSFYVMPVLLGLMLSVITGMLFGLYPAVWASKLNPIQLLRA